MLGRRPGEDKEAEGSGYYIAEVSSLLFESGAGESVCPETERRREKGWWWLCQYNIGVFV